ncbi:MAG: SoxR reducing system RseC family protein [Desulfobacteraceae bacterium]|nr:SoxR reducing system RseC family protein [Desulfobacteraceae bacterium]
MPQYEGYVAMRMAGGRAEVFIQPGSPGIPGVSGEVNRRVCHCASDGSSFTVEALNSAGAQAGDRVVVSLNRGALVRNVAAGLGPPLAGLVLSLALVSSLTHGFARNIGAGLLVSGAVLFSGIIVGMLAFRRFSVQNLPVVERIIMSRIEAPSRLATPAPLEDDGKRCQACPASPHRCC